MATAEYKVYEGLWTNLSEGKIRGATLTLSQTKAAYLIAFLALFVHFAGTSFWRFTSFLLFRSRAHLAPRDKAALQQQATLRNAPSAITALVNLVVATVRSSAKRWDSIALSAWALANFIAFVAAGILSSRVANTQPDVLLQPTVCGRWWKFAFGGSEGFLSWTPTEFRQQGLEIGAVADLHLTSSKFNTICYEGSKLRDACLPFVREPIGMAGALVDKCPFGDDICEGDIAYTVESDWIHSDQHLGINTEPHDRMRMQIRKTCSPLTSDGYLKHYDSSNISVLLPPAEFSWERRPYRSFLTAGHKYGAFFYGPPISGYPNATFIHMNGSRSGSLMNDPPIYSLYTDVYEECSLNMTPGCLTSFKPIAPLRRSEAATSIIFLTSEIHYCDPVNDPWFNAQTCSNDWLIESNWTVCHPAYPTAALACVEEQEICVGESPGSGRCVNTRVNGYPYAHADPGGPPNITQALSLNPRQAAIATRMQDASLRSAFAEIIYNMGGTNLLAYGIRDGPLCAEALPSVQWTKEIDNWFRVTLLNMQLYTTQFVTGWSVQEVNQHVTPPPDDQKWMCDSQIVRTTMYTNFSLLGILLILLIGGAFIVLRLATPYLTHKLQGSSTKNEHRRATWDELNLPRLADDVFEKQHSASDDERSLNSPQTSRVYIMNSWKSG